MDFSLWSDDAILDELGERLAQRRLDKGLTQAELASQAGVGRATVERLEAGNSTQLTSLLRISRVLGVLNGLIYAVPKPGISPIDLVKLKSSERKRATGKRKTKEKPSKPWTWADEH